ncbi:hypothetical protein LTS07_007111 [Exophiala sideris]|uniref:Xaa-Pro dipeptidyl-peptidase-like domain-containing protein n=1 Tax=Exophiala sideris TaxID=1016849 RepID=A0ABR0J4Z1_9EURO|nr:hypothetical protein LTS07_007111 [Exophiala sideris]KAK5056476.1 hypothetical protein LTR69_008017 [Exophiala sideris]
MALPKPNCSFVIPGVHDDLELNCRLYYPKRTEQNAQLFGRSFAIFAHPYAPLGGCYDDPVVGIAGGVLLRYGCVLITFNFRGASGSAGRTTWSGKAELADYVSVFGFGLCYIDATFRDVSEPVSGNDTTSIAGPPILILGGYSYGSMITAHLPSLETVVDVFKEPKPDSAESEIRLRARDLAKDMKAYFVMHAGSGVNTALLQSPSQMGGYGSDAAGRRIHRESSRRSVDGEIVRKSVDRVRRKLSKDTSGRIQSVSTENGNESEPAATKSSPVMPVLAYVLVSPLLSTVAGFTTMFSKLKFVAKGGDASVAPTKEFHELVSHPCCCLYGTEDMFTSERKLRRWTEDLATRSGPKFVTVTAQTGHFWREADGPIRIRQGLAEWLRALPPTLEESRSQNVGRSLHDSGTVCEHPRSKRGRQCGISGDVDLEDYGIGGSNEAFHHALSFALLRGTGRHVRPGPPDLADAVESRTNAIAEFVQPPRTTDWADEWEMELHVIVQAGSVRDFKACPASNIPVPGYLIRESGASRGLSKEHIEKENDNHGHPPPDGELNVIWLKEVKTIDR